MKYFTTSSRIFGRHLMRRRDTTIHWLKLAKRIAIVWDRRDRG